MCPVLSGNQKFKDQRSLKLSSKVKMLESYFIISDSTNKVDKRLAITVELIIN